MYLQMMGSDFEDERKPLSKRRWEDTLRREHGDEKFRPLKSSRGRDDEDDDFEDYDDYDDEDFDDLDDDDDDDDYEDDDDDDYDDYEDDDDR